MHVIRDKGVSDELMSDVLARDCVLWLTTTNFSDKGTLDRLVEIVDAPWLGVFVESDSAEFSSALEARNQLINSADVTGAFTHLIAADPTSLQLQRRAKPIFFLNGRVDRDGTESSSLSARVAIRRRLNMTARLRDLEPRRVLVVGEHPDAAIEELAALWDINFRSLLTIVTDNESFLQRIESSLNELDGLKVVHWIVEPPFAFATLLFARLQALSVSASIPVATLLPGGDIINVDVAMAEIVEQPIADSCDFVRVQDVFPISPEDLRENEFQAFFTRGPLSWRPYAAGLPWIPDNTPEKELLAKLQSQLADPPGSVQVLSVLSESGAGGTTQARALALAAAKAGFPVLAVKQESQLPSALELTGFLFRAAREAANQAATLGLNDTGEPVWLIVLDVQHGGRTGDDIPRLCAELSRSGRKTAILKVSLANSPLELPESIAHKELVFVQHELESSDVDSLGKHLNVYLRPQGKQKTREQWIAFWKAHQPDFDAGVSSFWIALEFWLAGFLQLGESIQGWVVQQFKNLRGQPELQRALLEIGALSIERRGTPERLLAFMSSPKLPWVVALDEVRSGSPGLGLVRGDSYPYGRVWAIAHELLARHLLNGVWNDRLLCEELGITPLEDSVALRLSLIESLSKRAAMGESFAKPFAVSLATSVLKLDEQYGNAEFFKYWRKVIEILESVPQTVRLSSRTFNHHLAISRRRVTQDEFFHLDRSEKRGLLRAAIQDVEFALNQIEPSQEDESTLNLLNTLALLFQDLADLERNGGDAAELARLLAKSDAITNMALKENPNNSYVLETAAKNQLRQGLSSSDVFERIESAAKALSFVFQASRLDTAASRRMKLGQLAAQSLRVLHEDKAVAVIERFCAQGSPYGFIAKAWAALPIAPNEEAALVLESVSPNAAAESILILSSAPERNWLLVRLLYDLVVIARPHDFQAQLRLLDELASTKGYQLSLQQVLERAVLLFITGQHRPAVEEFKWLRPRVKESQVVIFVPPRLRWLPKPDGSSRAVCTAQVVDSSTGARGMARVKEMGGALAPFNPQEFDKPRMAPNEQFKCQVTFAAMGPFLKPVDQSHRQGGAR